MRDQPKRPFVRRFVPRLVMGLCAIGVVVAAGAYLWAPNHFGPANRRHTRLLMQDVYDVLQTPQEDRVVHPSWSRTAISGNPGCPFIAGSAVGLPYRDDETANPRISEAADVFEEQGWDVQRAVWFDDFVFVAWRPPDVIELGSGGLLQVASGRCDRPALVIPDRVYILVDSFDE